MTSTNRFKVGDAEVSFTITGPRELVEELASGIGRGVSEVMANYSSSLHTPEPARPGPCGGCGGDKDR